MKYRIIYIFLTLVFLQGKLHAQSAIESFGKNRIQHKKLEWKFIISKHFYIYYYQGGNKMAHNAVRYAEEALPRITKVLGFPGNLNDIANKKITLFLYNSHADWEQSNIGIEDYYLIGGQTDLIKKKVEIAFPGTQTAFKEDLTTNISSLLVQMMIYGGSIKERVQNSYLLNFPEWFIEGLPEYLGKGSTQEMRETVASSKYALSSSPEFIDFEDSKIVGHSIWNYVAKEYGENSISNILNLTRISRSVEIGISSSLAIPYNGFINDWRRFYRQPIASNYGEQLNKGKNKKRKTVFQTRFSPDGKQIVWSENNHGQFKVYLKNIADKSVKVIYRGGHYLVKQDINKYTPILRWKSNKIVSITDYQKGYLEMTLLDIKENKKSTIPFTKLEQILDLDFSSDGKKIILSAVENGYNDLFMYDILKGKRTALTSDIYDDLSPQFVGKGYDIIFTSNRTTDTLTDVQNTYDNVTNSFNICHLKDGESIVTRYGSDNYSCISLTSLGKQDVMFIKRTEKEDKFCLINLRTQQGHEIDSLPRHVYQYDVVNNNISYVLTKNMRHFVYQSTYKKTGQPISINQITPIVEEIDTIDTIKFATIDNIDVKLLRFESDKLIDSLTGKTKSTGNKKSIWMANPIRYKNYLAADQITSTFLIEPLRGSGVLMEVNLVDLFEDHKIKVGAFGLTDLKSSNLFLEHQYLKKRLDFTTKFDKQSIYTLGTAAIQRYNLNEISGKISYPISITSRFSILSSFTHTRFIESNFLTAEDITKKYIRGGARYVYDNTRIKGMNRILGTRMKVSFDHYFNNQGANGFGKFKIDIRNYTKIHKEIIFASRFSGGAFTGQDRKNFLLGGMDNWLFSSTNFIGQSDPLYIDFLLDNTDLLFVDYVTAMRGFSYNKRFGEKYFLFNGEVRIPLVQYLSKGPITNGFLKNFQTVVFYDIGTVWTGSSPFSRNNSYNTEEFSQNPFSGTIVNYRNPLLAGYGIGIRSVVFGYYMKLDLAWGVEDFTVQSPKVHFTFGYDF